MRRQLDAFVLSSDRQSSQHSKSHWMPEAVSGAD
jgi:hypothetical protein